MEITKKQQPPPPPESREAQKCPRCDSSNTKFCYYNNYSLSQPRYYCRTCRRYWTHGGALRNVPVGGGSRKGSKRARTAEPTPPVVPAAEASAGYLPSFAFGQPQTQSYAQAPSSTSSSSSLGVSISTLLQGFGDVSGSSYGGSVHPHGQFFVNNPNPSRASGSNSSSLSHQAWPSTFNANTNIGAPSNANNSNNNNNTGGGFGPSFTARPSQWPHDGDLPGPFGSSPP